MAETLSACQSYRAGNGICMDGFPQKPMCSGSVGCVHCGRFDDTNPPMCLTDNFAPHLMDDAGRMRLSRPSHPGDANG